MKEAVTIVFGFLLIESLLISGCFITNCPPGGKRSGSDIKIRQCEQCGPPGMNGLCYGPHICCGVQGCLFGTSETMTCLQENLMHNTPCQNPGDSCSGNDNFSMNGQCSAPGVCCSAETCTMDDSCYSHKKEGQGGRIIGDDKAQTSHITTYPKEHAMNMFQNPLDRWIPRRFGLGSGRQGGQRKPVHVGLDAPEIFGVDRLVFTDTGRISNEEY